MEKQEAKHFFYNIEAEFRALLSRIDEVIWIQSILKDLQISFDKPIQVLWDNNLAISIAYDPIYHDIIKHVDMDHFCIKEKLEEKVICITHVTSAEHYVDIFTKGLLAKVFLKHVSKLGMKSIHSRTWGGVLWIFLFYKSTQCIKLFLFILFVNCKPTLSLLAVVKWPLESNYHFLLYIYPIC